MKTRSEAEQTSSRRRIKIDMKLTVLGCHGKYPLNGFAASGYLLQSERANILIDLGSGTLNNLGKILPYKNLDAIILTHHHGDHNSDTFVFRNVAHDFYKSGVWKNKLPVYMPATPEADAAALSQCTGFSPVFIKDGATAVIKDVTLKFYGVSHPIECYGVKAVCGDAVFAYTGDTGNCPNLLPLLDGAHIALADACVPDEIRAPDCPHIRVKEIAALCKNAGLTVLTHLEYGYEDKILAEARSVSPKAVLAEEGKVFDF